MTEAEWLACVEPGTMLNFLGADTGDRNARLCAVAFCFRDPLWAAGGEDARLVLLAEAFADGGVAERSLWPAARRPDGGNPAVVVALPPLPGAAFVARTVRVAELVCHVIAGRSGAPSHAPNYIRRMEAEQKVMASLVRDIFGNPFRPVSFCPEWRTSTVTALAQAMYGSHDFSAMPILADALQEAGCDSAEILDHCRGAGPHVRGCWVVDLVLGKE